jgi:hypothetical protein
MKTRRMYMHTLDGMPAGWDGTQIVYADQMPNWQDEPVPVQVYSQLRTLTDHVRAATRYRKRSGWAVPKYGWCVVEVPA